MLQAAQRDAPPLDLDHQAHDLGHGRAGAPTQQLRGAAAKSNEVLTQLGPDIQWVESFVAAEKTFCVYLAKDEAIIHKHAEISGFPATKVTEVRKMIDPTTEQAA